MYLLWNETIFMRRKLSYVELKCHKLLQLGIYTDLYTQFSLLFYEILMIEIVFHNHKML